MKKSTNNLSESESPPDPKAPVPKSVDDPITQNSICDHDWQPDGQTMTAVRWTCTKCHKTKLKGLEI